RPWIGESACGCRQREAIGVEAEPMQRRPMRESAAVQALSRAVVDTVEAGIHLRVAGERDRRPRVDLEEAPDEQRTWSREQRVDAQAVAEAQTVHEVARARVVGVERMRRGDDEPGDSLRVACGVGGGDQT